MTDKKTLRERLHNAVIDATDDEYGGLYAIALCVSNILLAEIERRCAERGYTDLVGWERGYMETTSVADFIAELRGEVSGGD